MVDPAVMAASARKIIAITTLVLGGAGFMGMARAPGMRADQAAQLPITVAVPPRARRALHAEPVAAPIPAAAPTPLVIKRVLASGAPITFGSFLWDEKDVPAGPVTITVDLAAQTLSVFRGGYEIGATAILYGTDETPTPLGTFPITAKDAHHVSRTYGGAPMPYALRLTPDGVAIHGSEVAWGYATHGCIGVPTAFARKLFGVAAVGDRVIITDGRSMATGRPAPA